MAFLILHFVPRSARSITGAGAIIGVGIPIMHCIGMSGMELCRPVPTISGVVPALVASVVLSVAAVWVACSARGRRNILRGTVGFGLAVFSVHFIAMAGTGFLAVAGSGGQGPLLRNETFAMIVTLCGFVISAAFLLTGITFAPVPVPAPAAVTPPQQTVPPPTPRPRACRTRVPYAREGRTLFLEAARLSAVEAEGHYTLLHHGAERLFCPWPITEADARLVAAGFLRVHRSWLVNPAQVTGFERRKDGGFCLFDGGRRVPVARSRITQVRRAPGP